MQVASRDLIERPSCDIVKDLLSCVIWGDAVDVLQALIIAEFDVNFTHKSLFMPFPFLQHSYSDFLSRTDISWTPIHTAAVSARLKFIRKLVEHGAIIDDTFSCKVMPQHLAAFMGHTEIISGLVECFPADLTAGDINGRSCLHWGCFWRPLSDDKNNGSSVPRKYLH
jgi:ankyrin repeat protein